ncbi:hypothetical protein N0V84_010432 [Fusarium piperis]|uniref:Uncharacterized protein n=1 Tax=Fusarium piperis TaxID=1435070 RepID=A0A9W8W4K3_9HYPO|nr:hypothetical protein N0V84_010432 [Fusarium piperis]
MGKTGDVKIESFIAGAHVPTETKSKEKESLKRTETGTETATKPEYTTSDIKPSPEPETNSEAAPGPQDDQDVKPTSDAQPEPPSTESSLEKPVDSAQETRDETTSEAAPVPQDNQDVLSASDTQSESSSAESCSERPIDPEQETRDETLTQATTPASSEQPLDSSEKNPDSSAEESADSSEDSMFELPVIPELEPTLLPTKRFRHDLVHDESLGVSALGVPADAIIINNPNQIRRSKKVPTVLKSQPVQPPSELDWQHLAPTGQEDEPSVEEIYRNIDELRPDTRFLRDSEIQRLTEVLRDGFTTEQLKEYSRLRQAEVAVEDAINYPWIVKHVPWAHPTKTELRGHDKLSCVQRIIFDKWKIESLEHTDDIGRTIVQMEPDFFVFLTFESERMVRELREDFFVDEEEKITIDRNLHHVNIVTRKSTAYGILAHLDQILQRRKVRDIPIQQHVAPIPSAAELEVLAQITKTSLKMLENQELRVSWLPAPQEQEDVSESKTEDVGDVVFRLLLGQPKSWTTVDLTCLPRPQTKRIPQDHFFDIRRQLKALSWREKLQGWRRVVTPINNKPDEGSPVPLDLAGSASLPEYKSNERGFRDMTTAAFGHILHNTPRIAKLPAAENDDLAQAQGPTSVAVLSQKPRTFSPLIPHPASFSALKPEGSEPLTQSTTIILNLAVDSDANKKGPVIQVRLPVDNEADLTNFTIPKDATAYSVDPWYRSDLLLPGESVDVRIQHERLLPLDMDASGVRSFLETSEFNLLQGHLRTPSQASLLIPSAHPSSANQASSKSKSKKRTYTFRGLEIHQTVEMPWRGHMLRYSSIEAGQHGGQRQELTLQAGNPGDPDTSFEGEKRKSFMQLVEDMATGQCFSWTEGYESIKSRQLEDHSYDLPEEELTEDIIVENDKYDKYGRPNLQRHEEPEQPRKKYMPRREARHAPPRPRKFDYLNKTKQFRGADELSATKPKVKETKADVKEHEAKELEEDQPSAGKPYSTVSEAKESGLGQASVEKPNVTAEEIKEPKVKEPKADQTSTKKPQQGRRGAKSQSTTDLLHSFLDQFSDPMSLKTPTGQRDGRPHADVAALTNTILQKEVAKSNARQAQETSKARQASTSEDAFSAKFSARAIDKPPAPPASTQKTKKGTTRQRAKKQQATVKKQQASPSHSSQFKDPFAAAFANRLSTSQHSSSGGGGFFDDLPKPQATKKKGTTRGKRIRR